MRWEREETEETYLVSELADSAGSGVLELGEVFPVIKVISRGGRRRRQGKRTS